MRIDAVAHILPRERFANDDVVRMFRDTSCNGRSPESWKSVERRLTAFLKRAGSECRYIAARDESPLDLAVAAAEAALEQAGCAPKDIELIIYASVSRGWLEPSTAVAVQHKLQAANATSFDVVDACASWLRALHVAHGLLHAGAYRNALIIAVEAGMSDFIRFEIADAKALERYSAASTLGNTATATLVSATPKDDFYFVFRTYPADIDLCMMPLSNFATFLPELAADDVIPNKFMAHSTPLLKRTLSYLAETFNNDAHLRGLSYDISFSHAVSAGTAHLFGQFVGFQMSSYFGTYAEYGNTAAASIPLGMSLALQRDRLRRGDRTLIGVGSAGITVGFATFTF